MGSQPGKGRESWYDCSRAGVCDVTATELPSTAAFTRLSVTVYSGTVACNLATIEIRRGAPFGMHLSSIYLVLLHVIWPKFIQRLAE